MVQVVKEICYQRAMQLHQYLLDHHWSQGLLMGPDPIGKINWRISRFARNYLPFFPMGEQFVYLQGQAYWIQSNLILHQATGDNRFLRYATACADRMVERQSADGVWYHPPIWGRQGFISTVEGVWASLGLLAAYRASANDAYLEAAIAWYRVQTTTIGFQTVGDGVAPNYYAHSTMAVPNVTTMLIWLTVELYELTKDETYRTYTEPMMNFVAHSQLPSGELPYVYQERPHFMCFQYNAYQFIDLAHTYRLQPTPLLAEILRKLINFLSDALLPNGAARYNCSRNRPEVTYWGAALAEAFYIAQQIGLGDYTEHYEKAFHHLVAQQRPSGGFGFSKYNYGMLQDNCSYPRYQAMILRHLLALITMEEGTMDERMMNEREPLAV